MTRIKSSRILAMLLVMVMMLGVLSPAAQARGIGGSVEVNVNSVNYTITTKYVDKAGNSIQGDTTATLTGAGQTYTAAPDTISGYVYKGFYIDGVGSLSNLTTGDLTVATKSDASDSTSGQGYYTLYAIYGKDENNNEIDDDDENYVITEYFTNESGTVLLAANTVNVNGGVHYYGTPPTIPGYLYKGYYFTGTSAGENDTHTSGSLANPLSGNPYILLQSKTLGVTATYDVTMVYERDPSQYATVTFDANGGQGTMATQTVLKNTVTQLDANTFTMPGYTFDGWSLTAGGTAVYADGADITVSADTTLYATWKYDPSQWATITFDANGGQGTMAAQTILKNTATQLSANMFTMPGYSFDGWSLTAGGGVDYADGGSITVSADTTLYATWKYDSDQYATVTFDANGGQGTMAAQTVLKNTATQLNANTFTMPGYTFNGWSLTADGGVNYADGGSITVSADTTLYATWKYDPSQWATVTFDANGGQGAMMPQTVLKNTATQLDANTFTMPGYIFDGWSLTAGGAAVYADGDNITVSADTTLYATWKYDPSQWATITFDANGGQGTMAAQTVLKNTATQLNANAFTMPGYAFDGWSLTAGGGAAYGDGQNIIVSADTTLYATWKYDPSQWATVTFDANGGQGTMAAQTILKNTATPLDANTFTMPGYIFDGWSLTADGTAVYADGENVTISADTTLYATWKYDPSQWATVTFDGNGAAAGSMASMDALKGSTVTLTANAFVYDPNYPNWDLFSGWSTDGSQTALADKVYDDEQEITVNDDMTLYAIWGTPDLAGSMSANQNDYQIGETIKYDLYVYNRNTSNSVTLYNGYIEIIIPVDRVDLNENSLRATSPDGSQKYMMAYDYDETTGLLKITLNDFKPGDEYKITFSVVTKVAGSVVVDWSVNGSGVYPTSTRSLRSLSNGNGRGIGGSVSVNIK